MQSINTFIKNELDHKTETNLKIQLRGKVFVNYGQFFDDATDFKFTPGSVCSPSFYLSNYLNATGTNDERIIFFR